MNVGGVSGAYSLLADTVRQMRDDVAKAQAGVEKPGVMNADEIKNLLNLVLYTNFGTAEKLASIAARIGFEAEA